MKKIDKTIPCEFCGINIHNGIMRKSTEEEEPQYICEGCYRRLKQVNIINGEEQVCAR